MLKLLKVLLFPFSILKKTCWSGSGHQEKQFWEVINNYLDLTITFIELQPGWHTKYKLILSIMWRWVMLVTLMVLLVGISSSGLQFEMNQYDFGSLDPRCITTVNYVYTRDVHCIKTYVHCLPHSKSYYFLLVIHLLPAYSI